MICEYQVGLWECETRNNPLNKYKRYNILAYKLQRNGDWHGRAY